MNYRSQLVAVDDFTPAADRFFADGGLGLNITVPFLNNRLGSTHPDSRLAPAAPGAVNTLARQGDGTVLGDTTDGIGMVNDIRRNLGWAISGKTPC